MADDIEDVAELKFADATHVHVLETNVLQVNDIVYWLDGSSAEAQADMRRIDHSLRIVFSSRPQDLRVVAGRGQMALWRRPVGAMVPGVATEAQRQRSPVPPFTVAGEVSDPGQRFNPARFELLLGAGEGVAVVLYPTPFGTSLAAATSVIGTLRQTDAPVAASWALLELEVNLSLAETQVYRAQADRHGDFAFALERLPPLPQSLSAYDAVLRVRAGDTELGATAPDTDAFVRQEIEASATAAVFSTELTLTVRPGEVTRVNSFDKPYLAVQPA